MNKVINQSKGLEKWEQDGLRYTELIRQEYGNNNCIFAAGTVEGHSVDTMWFSWQRDGDPGGMLLMRPDEMAALAWCINGVLWSHLLDSKLQGKG